MTQDKKIQEIQMMEQGLQNLLLQKQAFQMELSETQAAKREVEKSDEDVFKIIGQLMIKTEKGKVQAELSNKEKLLELRVKSIEKQESAFLEKMNSLKKEILD